MNIKKSGTRREERLMDEDKLRKVWILRKLLHPMDELAAMEFLLDRMKETKTNDDFFDQMKRKAEFTKGHLSRWPFYWVDKIYRNPTVDCTSC